MGFSPASGGGLWGVGQRMPQSGPFSLRNFSDKKKLTLGFRFETEVLHENLEIRPPARRRVTKRGNATATGPVDEGAVTTNYELARRLAPGAASVLQMNLGRVGGILEAKKFAGMAVAHGAQIAPHLSCGPGVAAANIQISACSPNFLILESIERFDGFQAKWLKKPIRWEEGYVIPSDEPGLGGELDEKVAPAHPFDGKALHRAPSLGHAGRGNEGGAAGGPEPTIASGERR